MNKLTKLMLASALLATSGFAEGETVSTLSDAIDITEKGIVTVGENDVVLNGTMTLATSNTAEDVAQLVIDKEKTFEIRSGTLSKSGSGTKNAKITLHGTMSVAEVDLDNNGVKDKPSIDMNGIDLVGKNETKYFFMRSGSKVYKSWAVKTGDVNVGSETMTLGEDENGYVMLYFRDSYWGYDINGVNKNNLGSYSDLGSSNVYKINNSGDLIVNTS